MVVLQERLETAGKGNQASRWCSDMQAQPHMPVFVSHMHVLASTMISLCIMQEEIDSLFISVRDVILAKPDSDVSELASLLSSPRRRHMRELQLDDLHDLLQVWLCTSILACLTFLAWCLSKSCPGESSSLLLPTPAPCRAIPAIIITAYWEGMSNMFLVPKITCHSHEQYCLPFLSMVHLRVGKCSHMSVLALKATRIVPWSLCVMLTDVSCSNHS